MTDLKIIKSFPFLKPYLGKKDGKNQVMIRIRLGTRMKGKNVIEKTIDIPIISSNGERFKLTKQQFKNIKSENDLMSRFYEVSTLIDRAVFVLQQERIDINTRNLFNYIYAKTQFATDKDEYIDNEEVRKFFDYPVPVRVWETFISQPYIDEETNEPVQYDILEDIAKSIETDYYFDKKQEEIQKMDFNERYKLGYYDKENIYECFGFCWSNDPKSNDSLVPDSYKSLIVRLHDYRYNENPSEFLRDFNDEWIEGFLKFLVKDGYSTFIPRSYDPFSLSKYRLKFINSERRPYRYAGFEKAVKHLKRYIFLLQKYKIIAYDRNPQFISAKDYVGRNVLTTSYTRREHSLTQTEFDALCSKDFNDRKLNAARDMFILAVLGGGFRGEELYNHQLNIEKRDGRYILQVYHSKTSKTNINPVFGALRDVIDRNNGGLPEFLPKEEFRKALKKIAEELNFDRIITSPNTLIGSNNKLDKVVLKDIFSIYFARKTYVSMLDAYGMPEEDIIEFTSHSKTDTLKHYKGRLSLAAKESILKKYINGGGVE